MGRCPICDNKAMNCDCTSAEIDMHEQLEEMQEQLSSMETLPIERISVIDLGPNDVLVLETDRPISDEEYERIKVTMTKQGIKAILLEEIRAKGVIRMGLDATDDPANDVHRTGQRED